jgi:hypothetical protein
MSGGDVTGLPVPVEERDVSRKQFAEQLSVHPSTVDRWVRDGMPSETWGLRIRRFLPSRALAWLREREYAAPTTSSAPAPVEAGRGHGPRSSGSMSNADPSGGPVEGRRA